MLISIEVQGIFIGFHEDLTRETRGDDGAGTGPWSYLRGHPKPDLSSTSSGNTLCPILSAITWVKGPENHRLNL